MMKKTIIVLLAFSSLSALSQTREKDIRDNPRIKARLENNGPMPQADVKVSHYYGLEGDIKALMKEGNIPESCPTSLNQPDKSEYLKLLNQWIRENQQLVRDEKKGQQITE